MEHRHNKRFKKQQNVIIHVTGTRLLNGVMQNLSRGGVALTITKGSHLLKRNAIVRLAINTGQGLLILTALVIRNTEGFAALMFDDIGSKEMIGLDRLLCDEAMSSAVA